MSYLYKIIICIFILFANSCFCFDIHGVWTFDTAGDPVDVRRVIFKPDNLDVKLYYFSEDINYERKSCTKHKYLNIEPTGNWKCDKCNTYLETTRYLSSILGIIAFEDDIAEIFESMSPSDKLDNALLPNFSQWNYSSFSMSKSGFTEADMYKDDFLKTPTTTSPYTGNGYCQIGYYQLSSKYNDIVEAAIVCNETNFAEYGGTKFNYYKEFKLVINKCFIETYQKFFEIGDNSIEIEDPDLSDNPDRYFDIQSFYRHEFGHAASLDHTTMLRDDEIAALPSGTTAADQIKIIKKRLMYADFCCSAKDDVPAIKTWSEDDLHGYKCIYNSFYSQGETYTTNYDNCEECITYHEYYSGSGGGNSPINYSLTDFNGKLNWQIENPALANKISGYNIFVKTESGYTSINKAFIRSGSKAFYSVVPENYDNNSEYRLEVVYKNGLRDFMKFDK